MATSAEITTLHRYYMWSNRLRELFEQNHPTSIQDAIVDGQFNPSIWFASDASMFMAYWYTALHVVVEGWNTLGLHDSEVDELLTSPNLEHLRRYRNGICHFQSDYFNPRFAEIMNSPTSVAWVRQLNHALGRVLLSAMQRGDEPTESA